MAPVLSAALLAAAAAALLPVAAHAAPTRWPDAATASLLADPAEAMPAAPAPWWMAFDDATLNLLVHWAQQRGDSLQPLAGGSPAQAEAAADATRRQVVAAYIGARVLSARWLALSGVAEASARQLAMLAAFTPGDPGAAATREALRQGLAQRTDQVSRLQQALALERAGLLEVLAASCGLPTEQLTALLAPALGQPTVPSFASAVPPKLPRSILRARPDVAAAEATVLRAMRTGGQTQHGLIAHMQQPAGWIEPVRAEATPPAPERTAPSVAPPELEALNALLSSAENEVAHHLSSLSERARVQAERAQRTDASRQAFLAARERLKAGELDEWQLLEQYQQLLAESDRYASACGELAMAWLHLVASTGASPQVLTRR